MSLSLLLFYKQRYILRLNKTSDKSVPLLARNLAHDVKSHVSSLICFFYVMIGVDVKLATLP